MREIDNFDAVRGMMEFRENTDRYVVHVLRRPKDCKKLKNSLGSNESQRMLRTYFVDSLDYFDRKREAIRELCQTTNARAYVIPQVRNNRTCMLNLLKVTADNIDNPTIKPEHLLRTAWCGEGSTGGIDSDRKRWVLDLDDDNMVDYRYDPKSGDIEPRSWTADEVAAFVKRHVAAAGKDVSLVGAVKTKNGSHVITPPFNLQSAQRDCSMLYEGRKERVCFERVWTGPGESEYRFKAINGWLHKTGMTLLYAVCDD